MQTPLCANVTGFTGQDLAPYQLTIEECPGYLHATVVGSRTAENATRFFREVAAACARSGHLAVLLEMRLSGPSLDAGSIFRVISARAPEGSKLQRIAYVEASVDDPAMPRFAETVAQNRGVNVRLFPDVASAARWLSEERS